MARIYQEAANCSLSTLTGAYVYDIKPAVNGSLAAITSEDKLVVVDRQSLSPLVDWKSDVIPAGVTCLDFVDNGTVAVTAGREGKVVLCDVRAQKPVHALNIGRSVTALASSSTQIAVGTESANRDAVVSVWDGRQLKELWRNAENNDDITDVKFHPKIPHNVLAGGDDGLVSIFDTTISEEDDSLVQVINHGPIHKAGFLDEVSIYALSSDQNLSVHAMTDPDNDLEEPAPSALGDLRPIVPCEYVIDILHTKTGPYIAAGVTESNPHVGLVRLQGSYRTNTPMKLDTSSRITLQGAHGEEIVRSIFIDEEADTIFTAGEDGQIRSFRPMSGQPKAASAAKNSRIKKGNDLRYNPY